MTAALHMILWLICCEDGCWQIAQLWTACRRDENNVSSVFRGFDNVKQPRVDQGGFKHLCLRCRCLAPFVFEFVSIVMNTRGRRMASKSSFSSHDVKSGRQFGEDRPAGRSKFLTKHVCKCVSTCCIFSFFFSLSHSYRVLRLSDDMSLTKIHWDLALCLLFAWVVCYFCIWKGIKSTGKASCAPPATTHNAAPYVGP